MVRNIVVLPLEEEVLFLKPFEFFVIYAAHLSPGNLSGVISERDYVTKIALLGKTGRTTKVKEISTKSANLITASPEDTVDSCMAKMLNRDIRHLPLVDEKGKVVGIISIKDLIKSSLEEKDHTIHSLASFAVGEGGHFVM